MKLIGLKEFIFYEKEISANDKSRITSYSGCKFELLGRDSFKKDKIFAEKNRAERFCERFEKGHHCYSFLDASSRVVSYIWLSLASGYDTSVPLTPEIYLTLKPGSAYVWDCFTSSDYRRKGFYKQGLINAQLLCSGNGIKKVYICAEKNNVNSLSGIASVKFTQAFSLSLLNFGPLYLIKKAGNTAMLAKSGQCLNILEG